ncbi:hypothetical protein EVAR_18522_1 [Eumeta japonica]|uniref:Uncharacterized protein n=1 Tax=Eumeta variegata TaxID=151549 RepID=A0A4C1V4V9_EUMVA|nr:hypothetical protein EVAR_18522_1 [Eumeta japonica]
MTDAPKWLQFISGASACTYELYTLRTSRRGHAFSILSTRVPYALGIQIRGRTLKTALNLGLLLVPSLSIFEGHTSMIVYEPPESRYSSAPTDTRNLREVTSVLPASWEVMGYLMRKTG